jgi:hypothetical protein
MFAAMNSFLTPATAAAPPASYTITAGTRAPVFGSGAASPTPPTGYTARVTASADDANFNVSFGFTFNMAGTGYTSCFPSSNCYVTFGTGSNEYSGLGPTNPPYPKFFFMGADNSWQRVSTIVAATYMRIRFEGTASTSGTPGSPNIVYEATFFNPSSFGGNSVVELLVGTNNRPTGVMSAASASANYATGTPTANQSFVFSGNSTGTAWTILTGYYVAGTPY